MVAHNVETRTTVPRRASPESSAIGHPPDIRGSGPLPVDRITAAYNGTLGMIWLILVPLWSYAAILSLAHFAAAAMPRLLAKAHRTLSSPVRALREIYPLLWIPAFWTELDLVRRVLHDTAFDRPIAALDSVIFGTRLDQVWMPNMPAVWFSELMHLAYFGYYVVVALPLLYMAIGGSTQMKRDMTFRVVLVYLACFAVYVAFPVDGPHFLSEPYQGPLTEGFFYRLERALQAQGDSLGCAFPSSHVAAAVTMAYLGARWFSRPVAVLLSVAAVGVAVSTVYTQNHYAVDSLAGILFALWIQLYVAPVLQRWFARRDPSLGR